MTESVPLARLQEVVRRQVISTDDPLILNKVTTWSGIGSDCFQCDMCRERCDVGYETDWQWGTKGSTKRRTYVDWMCGKCLSDACKVSSNAAKSKYVLPE
jgi:bacterioferritin-associated ferredoxin